MVDYCPTDISKNPLCPHGPTLLFRRKDIDRKFYACSAFRNRKECSFFLWEDCEREKTNHEETRLNVNEANTIKIGNLPTLDRNWCDTCEKLFRFSEKSKHSDHNLQLKIEDISQPSFLFKPKENVKGESQYFFSSKVLNTLLDFLIQFKITNVLCIGCPRLHEHILKTEKMDSLLLDIDSRYFYEPNQFQLFNMFNCHMFNSKGWSHLKTFLSNGKVAIIVDPPFGGRTEPLADTFRYLESIVKESNDDSNFLEMLILPYFMEPFVKTSFPDFKMLDYKVDYMNHRKLKKHDHSTGISKSVVRIFTNVDPSRFVLPADEGYKYCDLCCRWVCNENRHCFRCSDCTSKNGAAYRHCHICQKCVKKTWRHCKACKICKLVEHRCEGNSINEEANSVKQCGKRKNNGKKKKNGKKFKRN